jgi:hypothetical protein
LIAREHRIDPRVLVERAHAQMRLPSKLDRLDASLALLRVAPDPGPRADALLPPKGLRRLPLRGAVRVRSPLRCADTPSRSGE